MLGQPNSFSLTLWKCPKIPQNPIWLYVTYMVCQGNQLTSTSSADALAALLRNGCRVIELDVPLADSLGWTGWNISKLGIPYIIVEGLIFELAWHGSFVGTVFHQDCDKGWQRRLSYFDWIYGQWTFFEVSLGYFGLGTLRFLQATKTPRYGGIPNEFAVLLCPEYVGENDENLDKTQNMSLYTSIFYSIWGFAPICLNETIVCSLPPKKTYTYEVISPFFPTAPYSKVSPPIWRHQWCNASNDEVYDGSKYGMQGARTDKDRCKGGAPTDDDLVGGTPVHHLIDGALSCCGHFVSTDTWEREDAKLSKPVKWQQFCDICADVRLGIQWMYYSQ